MYEATPDLDLNLAIINSFYEEETTSAGVELDKNVFGIGFGIQYKFN